MRRSSRALQRSSSGMSRGSAGRRRTCSRRASARTRGSITLRTAGDSWQVQFKNQDPNGFYDCFAFWTADRALVMADAINGRFPVRRTLDGRFWVDIGDNLPTRPAGEAAFAASGTCVATQGESTPGSPPAARSSPASSGPPTRGRPGGHRACRSRRAPAGRAPSRWPSATRCTAWSAAETSRATVRERNFAVSERWREDLGAPDQRADQRRDLRAELRREGTTRRPTSSGSWRPGRTGRRGRMTKERRGPGSRARTTSGR